MWYCEQRKCFITIVERMMKTIMNLLVNDFIDWDQVGEEWSDPKLPYPSTLCHFRISDGEM